MRAWLTRSRFTACPGAPEVFPALTGGALSADSIGLVARSRGRAAARSGRLPRVGEPGEPPPAWGGPAVLRGTASHGQLSGDSTRFARLRCCFGYASRRRARASTSGTSTARSRACPGMTRTGSHCSSKSTVRAGYARACSSARCSKDCKPSSTRPRACCAEIYRVRAIFGVAHRAPAGALEPARAEPARADAVCAAPGSAEERGGPVPADRLRALRRPPGGRRARAAPERRRRGPRALASGGAEWRTRARDLP